MNRPITQCGPDFLPIRTLPHRRGHDARDMTPARGRYAGPDTNGLGTGRRAC
ncbi:hypothetical protein [Komagataeibacter kakiaceti]